ncbi:MAG: outer membrane beta-barrel protein [Bacteroidales bacterium]|nr:outer membrane beta-barrel protein [Bacteroidales bacterium]MBK8883170.1 outer membrane beta-barrel protein [Bacteroidales bacterium]
MKKTLFLIVLFVGLIVSNVQAQLNFGATVGLQLPTGDMGDVLKTGFGLDLLGKYMVNDNLAVGVDVGWSRFGIDMSGYDLSGVDAKGSGSYVPITALLEYHFGTGKVRPFLGANVGLYTAKVKVTVQGMSVSDSQTNFGFAPVGGIEYDIQDNLAFTANLKYNYILTGDDVNDAYIGINVGIIYKLNK